MAAGRGEGTGARKSGSGAADWEEEQWWGVGAGLDAQVRKRRASYIATLISTSRAPCCCRSQLARRYPCARSQHFRPLHDDVMVVEPAASPGAETDTTMEDGVVVERTMARASPW